MPLPRIGMRYVSDGQNARQKYAGSRAISRIMQERFWLTYPGAMVCIASTDCDLPVPQRQLQRSVVSSLSDVSNEIDVLSIFGPDIGYEAWIRAASNGKYAVQGLVHSLSPFDVIHSLYRNNDAPVQHNDAIVCTSEAAFSVVRRIFESFHSDHCGISLPIIPLFLQEFESNLSFDRPKLRQKYNFGANEIVLVQTARLSFAEKSFPHTLFSAVLKLSKLLPGMINLVLIGSYPNKYIREIYGRFFDEYKGNFKIHVFESISNFERDELLSVSDIACFIVDNYQETFGVALLEYMRSGLPIIASDFSGIRDIVSRDVGILIPTTGITKGFSEWALKVGAGVLDQRSASAIGAQFVSSDPDMIFKCIFDLVSDVGMIKKMGDAAKERFKSMFCENVVSSQYFSIWIDQYSVGSVRRNEAMYDNFYLMSDYLTNNITYNSTISCSTEKLIISKSIMEMFEIVDAFDGGVYEICTHIYNITKDNPGMYISDMAEILDFNYMKTLYYIQILAKIGGIVVNSSG